jgi:hypothetical protein
MKLKVRDPVSEVCAILTRFNMPNIFENGQSVVEGCIAANEVQGIVDGPGFVSKTALERESEDIRHGD